MENNTMENTVEMNDDFNGLENFEKMELLEKLIEELKEFFFNPEDSYVQEIQEIGFKIKKNKIISNNGDKYTIGLIKLPKKKVENSNPK
jgi:hypothetical protein